MAVPFSKLNCKIDDNHFVPVQIGDETIGVRQYLPVQEKLALISRVITQAHEEDGNYWNPVKVNVFKYMEIIFAYTDIEFTDEEKTDLPKLYDALNSSFILNTIISHIPTHELDTINTGIKETIASIYSYQNSTLGILNGITNSYDNTEMDVEKLQKTLADLAESPLVKEILPLVAND